MYRDLFEKWILLESRRLNGKKRNYKHFDNRINLRSIKNLKSKLSPEKIAKHSFYPLINMKISTPRYKKDEFGNRKKEMKIRPISYASHFDSLIYSYYSFILSEAYEVLIQKLGVSDSVLAYLKKGKSNIDFAFDIFNQISERSECVAITADITGFFDNLDHQILKESWARVCGTNVLGADHYNIYKSLTKFSVVEKEALDKLFINPTLKQQNLRYCTPSEFRNIVRKSGMISVNCHKNKIFGSERFNKLSGIPQGTPISAVLSNIYMIEFDSQMVAFAKSNKLIYRRYCDDILLICDKLNYNLSKEFLLKQIKSFELEINDSKTLVIEFSLDNTGVLKAKDHNGQSNNLQYLGFEYDGTNIYVRSSSISRYKRRLKSALKKGKKAAIGKNSMGDTIFLKKIYRRFGASGNRNFLSYVIRSKRVMDNSQSLKKQYKRCIRKLLIINKLKILD